MKFFLSIILSFGLSEAFSQKQAENYALESVSDSTAYPFSYIMPSPQFTDVKLPATKFKYFSLSRSLKFASLKKEVAVLIGKDQSGRNVIVLDENMNGDLSDDNIQYFDDTLRTATKGNFRHFKSAMTIDGKVLPVEFDYSIIKPQALKLDLGDSLENKIHFMVRPYAYQHTIIKVDTASYRLVLFSKNVFDFGKKSSFLVVASPDLPVQGFKSNDKVTNRYAPGDVILLGENKFIFEKIASRGDSITLSQLDQKALAYGSKIGFLSPEIKGTNIASNDSVSMKKYAGKYVVLDFWGTWCAPCIKLLPDLKKLHQSIDNQQVEMIGVCYDTDIKKARQFITDKNMNWVQIFDPQKNSVLAKNFDITSFPSFVIIDPAGKIVFKDEGLNGFQRLLEQLDNLERK